MWQPKEGSFKALANNFSGEWHKFHYWLAWLNRLPQMTYLLGEKKYWESYKKHGAETWWAPHNLWRQPFHILIGLFVSFLLASFLPVNRNYIVMSVFIISIFKETVDASENGWHVKSFVDIGAWVLGSILFFI